MYLTGPLRLLQEMGVGDSEVVMTGGSENMSLSPYAVRGVRFGTKLGQDLLVTILYHSIPE